MQFSNHYASSYGPQLHPQVDATAFIPLLNPQWAPQPQQPYHAPQLQQLFTFPSVPLPPPALETAPPPIINVTAPPPRKRKNAISSGSTSTAPAKKKRKPRASATNSATSLHVPPPSPICGVGPSLVPLTPVLSEPSPSALPSPLDLSPNPIAFATALPTLSTTSVSPTPPSNVTLENNTNSAPSTASATDVWYFIRALHTADRLPDNQLPPLVVEPRLRSKPNKKVFPYVGCTLCTETWQVWANGDGATTTIRKHLKKFHGNIYGPTIRISGLKHADEVDSDSECEAEQFTPERWAAKFVRWVVADDQSINVADNKEFREFALFGRDDVTNVDLPHRTKLTELINKEYETQHAALVKELGSSLGCISFTSDIWSDPNLASYMGISVHFCAKDISDRLVLLSRLLAFRVVPGSHCGVNMAQIFFDILEKAGILNKMGMLTLDNASNNGTFMEELENLFRAAGIPFHRDGNRIRCFPHVINVAVQTILSELKEQPRAPVLLTTSDPTRAEALVCYADALGSDPIGVTRTIVGACRASGQRRSALKDVINAGNATNHWGETIKANQLLRDSEIHWSSTRNMIVRMLDLYPAIQIFLMHPQQGDLAGHLFDEQEFQVLHDILAILEVPHAAQEVLSAEKTPTLAMALPAYEMVNESWLNLQIIIPELAHYIGVGIHKINEYITKGRKTRAYALAMIINPATKMKWIEDHWSVAEAEQARHSMIDAMTEYARERRLEANIHAARPLRSATLPDLASINPVQAQARGLAKLQNLSGATRRIVSLPSTSTLPTHTIYPSTPTTLSPALPALSLPLVHPTSIAPPETVPALTTAARRRKERAETALAHDAASREFDRYIEEGLTDMKDLNLVCYWNDAERVYPLSYKVALDILPIQASSVPCERAFSSSGETCTLRRSRILPDLLGKLQVLKHIYRGERLDFTADWIATEADYVIEGDVTRSAVEELLSSGKIGELAELLSNICP